MGWGKLAGRSPAPPLTPTHLGQRSQHWGAWRRLSPKTQTGEGKIEDGPAGLPPPPHPFTTSTWHSLIPAVWAPRIPGGAAPAKRTETAPQTAGRSPTLTREGKIAPAAHGTCGAHHTSLVLLYTGLDFHLTQGLTAPREKPHSAQHTAAAAAGGGRREGRQRWQPDGWRPATVAESSASLGTRTHRGWAACTEREAPAG